MSRAVPWRSNVFCDSGSPNDDGVILHCPRSMAFLLSDAIIDVNKLLLPHCRLEPHCEQITILTYWLQAASLTIPSVLALSWYHCSLPCVFMLLLSAFILSWPSLVHSRTFQPVCSNPWSIPAALPKLVCSSTAFAWYNTQLWDNFPVCECPTETTNHNTCCYSVRASIAIFSSLSIYALSFVCVCVRVCARVCVCVAFFFFRLTLFCYLFIALCSVCLSLLSLR